MDFVFTICFSEKIRDSDDVYESTLYFGSSGMNRASLTDMVEVVRKKSVGHILLQNVPDPENLRRLEQKYTVFSTVDELYECAGDEISSPQWQKNLEKYRDVLARHDTEIEKKVYRLLDQVDEFPLRLDKEDMKEFLSSPSSHYLHPRVYNLLERAEEVPLRAHPMALSLQFQADDWEKKMGVYPCVKANTTLWFYNSNDLYYDARDPEFEDSYVRCLNRRLRPWNAQCEYVSGYGKDTIKHGEYVICREDGFCEGFFTKNLVHYIQDHKAKQSPPAVQATTRKLHTYSIDDSEFYAQLSSVLLDREKELHQKISPKGGRPQKLTEKDKKRIHEFLHKGLTHETIAKRFNISTKTIQRILHSN